MNPNDRTPNQVLAERAQFIAIATLILFVGGWIGWFYPYDDLLDRSGTPLGADFAMFYVAGQVVLDGAGDQLYDQVVHQQRLRELFPGINEKFALPYRYPPFVALLTAPFAALPYTVAYGLFLLLSSAAWFFAARMLLRLIFDVEALFHRPLLWGIAGWPVALETLIGGQASMFALLIIVATYVLLRHGRVVAAGAVLALAAYKPNVLALVALGCFFRHPKTLKGFVPVAAACGLLSLLPNGWQGLAEYVQLTVSLSTEAWNVATPYWKVHGLAPWFTMLLPEYGREVCFVSAVAIVSYLALRAKRNELAEPSGQTMWFASLISINALFNPYTPIYDLVLLLAGGLLTAGHLASRYGELRKQHLVPAQLMLGVLYFGPHLSQATAKLTEVQPLAIALAIIAAWQVWLLFRPPASAPQRAVDQLPISVSGG